MCADKLEICTVRVCLCICCDNQRKWPFYNSASSTYKCAIKPFTFLQPMPCPTCPTEMLRKSRLRIHFLFHINLVFVNELFFYDVFQGMRFIASHNKNRPENKQKTEINFWSLGRAKCARVDCIAIVAASFGNFRLFRIESKLFEKMRVSFLGVSLFETLRRSIFARTKPNFSLNFNQIANST